MVKMRKANPDAVKKFDKEANPDAMKEKVGKKTTTMSARGGR